MRSSITNECDRAGAVEWRAEVLDRIRQAALDGLFAARHGGVEIGGVLLGTRAGGQVRVLSERPLECEHALGPGFALSGKDRTRLAALLQDGLQDGEGLEPVGWYHSRTRGEFALSAADLEIHDRYFPEAWQVVLLVRPYAARPAELQFFRRAADGSLGAESALRELAEVDAATDIPVVDRVPDLPVPSFGLLPAARQRHWLWLTLIPLVLLGAANVVRLRERDSTVSLAVRDEQGQLQIRWDRNAEAVRAAASARVEIAEGAARIHLELDGMQLRRGQLTYARQTGRVDVDLRIDQADGKQFEELAVFLGRAPPEPPTARLP